MVSPALRVAVERDKRATLPKDLRVSAIRTLAASLSVRLEEGTAPVALVDSAVLTALESGGIPTGFAAAFLLPSHHVLLSKRRYDERNYEESIRLAKEALKGANRLSSSGFVAACRYMCLAAARIGDAAIFDEGISRLEASAKDDWRVSSVSYLKGFNFRMKGNLPKAEEAFRRAYELSPGNTPAAREIAAICLERGNLDEAEIHAREAHSQATSNPYFLDILISVLVRRYGRSARHSSEIDALFEALKKIGEEEGKSFFTTRRAEFEHIWGNNKIALKLIEEAVSRTPHIFEPRRLHVEILLKEGNRLKAYEVLRALGEQVNSRDPSERRSNYRSFLETSAHYLVEVGQYKEAKDLYGDASVFTEEEKKKGGAGDRDCSRIQDRVGLFENTSFSRVCRSNPRFGLLKERWKRRPLLPEVSKASGGAGEFCVYFKCKLGRLLLPVLRPGRNPIQYGLNLVLGHDVLTDSGRRASTMPWCSRSSWPGLARGCPG